MFETLRLREEYVEILQKKLIKQFPQINYQVWVFGSFLSDEYTTNSDIDIALYCRDIDTVLDIKEYLEKYLAKDGLEYDIILFEFNENHYINIPIVFYGRTLTSYEVPNIIDYIKKMVEKWTVNPFNVLLERSRT